MKSLSLLAFLCVPYFVYSQDIPFLITTIPKSGTHLLCKTVEKVTGTPVRDGYELIHTYDRVLTYVETHPELPVILLVRDLRDVTISYVHHLSKQISRHPEPKYYYLFGEFRRSDEELRQLIPYWLKSSFDEKLTCFLKADSLCPSDIENFFRVAVALSKLPNVTLIRFENLIGPQGNGSIELQYQEVKKIAKALGGKLNKKRIQTIAESIFGRDPSGSWNNTFRKGQIGGWKGVFKEEHKEVFKVRFNDYLHYFNYLDNEDWE